MPMAAVLCKQAGHSADQGIEAIVEYETDTIKKNGIKEGMAEVTVFIIVKGEKRRKRL